MHIFSLLHYFIALHVCKTTVAGKNFAQCIFLKDDDYEHCVEDAIPVKHLIERKSSRNKTQDVCINEEVCRRNFSISYMHEMHSAHIMNQINHVFDDCCGNCVSYHSYQTVHHFTELINGDLLEKSDIFFPMIGSRKVKRMYGMHYIPIFDVPCAYYITLEKSGDENLIDLVNGCLKAWPLVVFCLILSVISGFVIWLLERKTNRTEFPKRFINGLYEGVWWAFVSMTTVGYGDRTPRSFLGRMFSIVWILVGIAIFAILTGSLTNEITSVRTHRPPAIHGKIVAGLEHQFHDATMVAQHGGIFKGQPYNDTVVGIMTMLRKLYNKTIDGIMVSSMTYTYLRMSIQNNSKYQIYEKEHHEMNLHLSEKSFIGETLTSGMLVKETKDYEYLRSYFEDNWITLQNCASYYLSKKVTTWRSMPHLTYIDGLLLTFVYVLLAILVGICCIGFFLEMRDRYGFCKFKKSSKEDKKFMVGILA